MRRLVVLFVALALLGGDASARTAKGGRWITLPQHKLSVYVPRGWYMTYERINGVVDPVTVFTASTFPVRARRQSSGVCSRALREAWRADGAYVQLAEERDGASRRTLLRRVQRRPRYFRLDARGAGGLCTPPNSGSLSFQDGGRAFYAFYGIGRRAPATTRTEAAVLLDYLRITPRS